MKFRTIYADPPWHEQGGGKIKRGAQKHYALLKTPEICALPVADVAGDNAHLYLWVTNNHLHDGLRVIEAWGFRYITLVTWAKDRVGLGQYFRGMTEHCIFAVRGRLPYRFRVDGKRAQGRTLLTSPRREHSAKPAEFRSVIEAVSHAPYLELFGRAQHAGWTVLGKEISGNDIAFDLSALNSCPLRMDNRPGVSGAEPLTEMNAAD